MTGYDGNIVANIGQMMNNQQIQYGGQSFGYGQQHQIIQSQQPRPPIPC